MEAIEFYTDIKHIASERSLIIQFNNVTVPRSTKNTSSSSSSKQQSISGQCILRDSHTKEIVCSKWFKNIKLTRPIEDYDVLAHYVRFAEANFENIVNMIKHAKPVQKKRETKQ